MCAGTFVHIHGMQSCEPSCIVVLTGALQATTTWIETSATRGRCGVASMGWSGGHMNTNKYHPGSVWAGVAATGQSNEDCEKKTNKDSWLYAARQGQPRPDSTPVGVQAPAITRATHAISKPAS